MTAAILAPLLKYGAPFTGALWCALVSMAAYRIFKTGKTAFWRATLFIALAAGTIINLKILGGPLLFSGLPAYSPQRPPCHIAEATNLLFYLRTNLSAVMNGHGTLWLTLSGGMILLLFTLALGRGWCGWACVFGGIDEGTSRLLPARWRVLANRIPPKTRYLSLAVLVLFLILGAVSLTPAYCVWLCPLKMTWGYLRPGTNVWLAAATVMTTAGVIFLLALPMLSGKRVFCACLCPFGAWQSLVDRINPYKVVITQNCVNCGQCAQVCTVLAIDKTKTGGYEISGHCVHCGKCAEMCPTRAIETTAAGCGVLWQTKSITITARDMFLLTALLTLGLAGLAILP